MEPCQYTLQSMTQLTHCDISFLQYAISYVLLCCPVFSPQMTGIGYEGLAVTVKLSMQIPSSKWSVRVKPRRVKLSKSKRKKQISVTKYENKFEINTYFFKKCQIIVCTIRNLIDAVSNIIRGRGTAWKSRILDKSIVVTNCSPRC